MLPRSHSTQIVSPQGRTLAWDADDRLWLLRAVEAEGPPQDLVAQTLVNRWAFLWDTTPAKYTRLYEYVRAYAQPVNPAWFPDGRLHLQALAKLADAEKPAAIARAEKRRDVHSTRTQFSPATTVAVDQALRGPVTIPAGALHYAAASTPSQMPVLVPAESAKHNTIYGELGGRGSRARYSLTTAGAAGPSPQARLAVALVAMLAFALGLVHAQRLK